jgi:hypothetical protein
MTMSDEIKHWEYRVQTVGGIFRTKDEEIQEILDEWGSEGWEAFSVYHTADSARVTIVAKRPLTDRVRRIRSMPQIGIDR